MNKQWSYQLVKASEVSVEKVQEFLEYCDSKTQEGEPFSQSIKNLLKFVNGEINEESTEERSETIFTLSWKNEHGAVAVRVNSTGQVVTKNGAAQIADAIAFLQSALASVENQPVK